MYIAGLLMWCGFMMCMYVYSWSPDVVWVHDVTVQWNGKESFKAEGPQSVAIPCHSSQEFFYVSKESAILQTQCMHITLLYVCENCVAVRM